MIVARAFDISYMRPIPNNLPVEMAKCIEEIKLVGDKEQALKQAYSIITSRYKGQRLKTLIYFWKLATSNPHILWTSIDFLHCTNMNFLLRILLVKSGWFTDADIKPRWTLIWFFSPHQYLRVRLVGGNWINVDAWGAAHGIGYGDYAHGFH